MVFYYFNIFGGKNNLIRNAIWFDIHTLTVIAY